MSELKYQLMLNKEMSWVPCYLKSEADNVIAHNKYKRCENMALKCAAYSVIFQYKVSILDDEHNLRNIYRRKRDRMDRWALRWFKLAKEFKRE